MPKSIQVWDLWYPNAGAQGLSFARGRLEATGALLVHAPPETLRVEVRTGNGKLVAFGDQLARTAELPMARLVRHGHDISRVDLWPEDEDIGRPVILPGGEVGMLVSWWNAADGQEWRWQISSMTIARGGSMRAVQLTRLEGPDGLELVDVEQPSADGRLIVEVHAAGVGFPDLLMTRGRYQFRPEPPFIPGIEMAGKVHSAPEGSPYKPGDRICAWSPLGAWAEYAVAAPLAAFGIPDGMSYAQATSLVNYQSAYFGLVDRGQARSGDTVLIHGAAGGVGSAAVDVAKGLGLTSIAVARGEEKLAVVRELGADYCIEAESDWLPEVKHVTQDKGVDLVFDPVGGDRFLDSVRSMGVGGRLLVIGFAGGAIPEVKVNRLLLRNSSVVGVAWGEYIRHDPEMPKRVGQALAELWAAGKINPVVGTTLPLERAADALREIEERRAVGKLVLTVRD